MRLGRNCPDMALAGLNIDTLPTIFKSHSRPLIVLVGRLVQGIAPASAFSSKHAVPDSRQILPFREEIDAKMFWTSLAQSLQYLMGKEYDTICFQILLAEES